VQGKPAEWGMRIQFKVYLSKLEVWVDTTQKKKGQKAKGNQERSPWSASWIVFLLPCVAPVFLFGE
jgi:hypothetical protein